jgi:amidohydrolase
MKQAIILFLLIPAIIHAQTNEAALNENIKAIMPKVIEWRRHFHQNPELSNREYKTGAFVADYLKSIGLEVKYPVAKTGVVAILKGGKPGPVIALRADMDALPLIEKVDLPFKSVVTDTFNNQAVGVMHACGHDSHTAMLMGAATVLSKMKKDIQGTVVFLFQPAEEGAPQGEEAGAPLMVKEGVLDDPKVEAVFGLHIMSFIEAGNIAYKSGAFMASSDWFTITVNGKGSHGSQPWLSVDPVVVSAQIINGLQTIVSRQEDITKAPVVISVGSINSGNRPNIIPAQCTLTGTVRTLDRNTRKDVFERMQRTAESIAASAGATATISFDEKTLVTYNDPALVKNTVPALEAAAGKDHVIESNWYTYSEDFSYYGEKTPSFFFYLGGMPKGNDAAKAPAHHTADFYIDESGFDVGVKAFCEIVFNYANNKK